MEEHLFLDMEAPAGRAPEDRFVAVSRQMLLCDQDFRPIIADLPLLTTMHVNLTALEEHGYNIVSSRHPEAIHRPRPRAEVREIEAHSPGPDKGQPGEDRPPRYFRLVRDLRQMLAACPEFGEYVTLRPLRDYYAPHPERDRWLEFQARMPDSCATIDLVYVFHVDFPGLLRNVFGADPGAPVFPVFLNSGQHAREWLSQKTFFQFIRSVMTELLLLLQAHRQGDFRRLAACDLRHYVLDMVPIVNVMGHLLTVVQDDHPVELGHDGSSEREGWHPSREDRKPLATAEDLNRNWRLLHGRQPGCSYNPTAQDTSGPYPFSAIETRALAQFLHTRPYRYVYGLDIHSYSNIFLMFPSFNLEALLREVAEAAHPQPSSLLGSLLARPGAARSLSDRDLVRLASGELMTKHPYAAETAFLALWHRGPRVELLKRIEERMGAHFIGYRRDDAVLGYETTGAASDYYYAKLGMLGGGIEIGDTNSKFASDGARGPSHQLNVARQLWDLLKDPETQEIFALWQQMRAAISGDEKAIFEQWQKFED